MNDNIENNLENLSKYLRKIGMIEESDFILQILVDHHNDLMRKSAYNKPRVGKKRWSVGYKKKINCSNPKGFSQKQYCKRKIRGGNYK